MAQERYGITGELSGSPIERVRQILEMGKVTLSVDGFIVTTVWLMRGDEVVDIQVPVWGDQAGKMLAMHDLATRVQMLNADGFCLLGEVWTAPAPTAEQIRAGAKARARNHPDRTEGIHAFAITKDGEFLSIVTPFRWEGEKLIVGGADAESSPSVLPLVQPIMRVWGIESPRAMDVSQWLGEEDHAEDPRP